MSHHVRGKTQKKLRQQTHVGKNHSEWELQMSHSSFSNIYTFSDWFKRQRTLIFHWRSSLRCLSCFGPPWCLPSLRRTARLRVLTPVRSSMEWQLHTWPTEAAGAQVTNGISSCPKVKRYLFRLIIYNNGTIIGNFNKTLSVVDVFQGEIMSFTG